MVTFARSFPQRLREHQRALSWLLGLLGLPLLAVALWMTFRPSGHSLAPHFITAPVVPADIEDAVLASGTLQAVQQVSVGAQVSGQIKALRVKLGDVVKQGDLIAEIDSLPQQNALRTAEAGVRNAQAQLAAQQASLVQNELAFKRQQELLEADAGTRADLDTARATLDTTRANIAALEATILQSSIAVDTARLNLGYSRVLAPIDGKVVAVVAQQGQTVTAGYATPTIVKLAQLDQMTVKTQISEADVVRVQPGQRVYFTILGEPDRRYETRLRTVEPAPDSIQGDANASGQSVGTSAAAVYYNGLLDVPNPDGKLRIAMTAQVSIVRAEAKQALTIPSTALGERGPDGRYSVRVLGADGQAVPRPVRIGIDNHVVAQVLDGLKLGDQVVVADAMPMTEGMADVMLSAP